MTALAWVVRWMGQIPAGGRVLDVACGNGRHAGLLAAAGFQVDAVDRDLGLASSLHATAGIHWHAHDLEAGAWPFPAAAYAGVVVTNYLHRPLFPRLVASLARGGVLIYETFALGQALYGRPRNPAHLLLPGELLELARGQLRVVAYEDVLEPEPRKRVQRLCAIRP